MAEWLRRFWPFVVAGLVGGVLLAWLSVRTPEQEAPGETARAEVKRGRPQPDDARREAIPPREAPEVVAPGSAPESPPEEEAADEDPGEGDTDDEMAEAWATVDFEQVRQAMPDNLFFKLSAPTKDEAVLAERQAERERWNTEYGKILSGTGTDEEIRGYYDLRARLSTDYVEFSTYLLDHYGDKLPARDVELLKLARRMHLSRLEEIPRKVEEAFERKRQQDEAREAWLADEAKFGAKGSE